MNQYLDADIFLALIKSQDRFKSTAHDFFESSKPHSLFTSSLTCLEVWFYLHKNNHQDVALDAIRAIKTLVTIIDYKQEHVEEALLLAKQHHLTPADAIHAVLASKYNTIVSTDKSFDKIPGLKRIDFSITTQ